MKVEPEQSGLPSLPRVARVYSPLMARASPMLIGKVFIGVFNAKFSSPDEMSIVVRLLFILEALRKFCDKVVLTSQFVSFGVWTANERLIFFLRNFSLVFFGLFSSSFRSALTF